RMQNLLIGLAIFFVFVLVSLAAARAGKVYLFATSITFILISNITVQMSVELLPGVVISWAVIIYSLVYLVTDFVIEFYGRSEAYRLAVVNLVVQYVLWLYVWLSLMVHPAPLGDSDAVYTTMKSLFGTTTQISVAATIAAVGPFADILITDRFREYLKTRRLFRHEILNIVARAKLSTLIGEFINTVLFFSIALMGTGLDAGSLASIILSATAVKWAIAALDAPFLYMFFRYLGTPPDVCAGAVSLSPENDRHRHGV
ncbi:MAG: queuosine precursor transporter, partial [Pseudomonadota bacterium]|nr:queuosine precursor transporter [Pseudomonadota bacterium]